MNQKKCRKCEETKSLVEFNKHRDTKDGYLNKCKGCEKIYNANYRAKNRDKLRKYDKDRGNSRRNISSINKYKEKYPKKIYAQNMIKRAIKQGKLFKEDCSNCGSKEHIHAHHDDYAKPLNIRWLCAGCHRQWHEKHGQALNGS
jgi:hypothetical protein